MTTPSTELNEDGTPKTPNEPAPLDAAIQARIDAEVLARIAKSKEALDKAYATRDDALAKLAEREQKERDAEIARLRAAGNEKEAHTLELAELRARADALEKRNTELSRDNDVRSALAAHPLRNDKAAKLAYQDIVAELVRDEKGNWVHKSGIALSDFVTAFAADKDNEFLFKPKANSGSGGGSSKPSSGDTRTGSLFGMSQDDVLKMAVEGKLPSRRK